MTMPETVNTRTIEVSPYSEVASDIASVLSSRAADDDRDRIQSLQVSSDGAEFTRALLSPVEALADIRAILADSDLDDVPDDPEVFDVKRVNIEVEEFGTVRIAVYDE